MKMNKEVNRGQFVGIRWAFLTADRVGPGHWDATRAGQVGQAYFWCEHVLDYL